MKISHELIFFLLKTSSEKNKKLKVACIKIKGISTKNLNTNNREALSLYKACINVFHKDRLYKQSSVSNEYLDVLSLAS